MLQLAMAIVAFAVAALVRASIGVVYLILFVLVVVNVCLVAREEGIDVRRTIYNPFRGRRRKS
jgi:hypothetical protein